MRKVFSGFIIVVAVMLLMSGAVWAESKLEISVHDNKLSVDLVEAELTEVLKRLSEKAGIEITIGEGVAGTVTVKFADMPLQEGLEKIIGQSDYALEYEGEGLSKVKLVNKKGEALAEGCGEIRYDKMANALKFLDCGGKVIKQIDMTCKWPFFNKNNKYVAIQTIVTDTPEAAAIEVEKERDCYDRFWKGGHQEVSLMDSLGNVLWSKRLPDQRSVSYRSMVLSDNAEIVAFNTVEFESEPVQIFVYNKEGKEVVRVPKEMTMKKGDYAPAYEFKISPNGKYLGARVDKHYAKSVVVFYDLKKGTSWEYPGLWGIKQISSDGKTTIYSGPEKKEFDLKKYLGGDL